LSLFLVAEPFPPLPLLRRGISELLPIPQPFDRGEDGHKQQGRECDEDGPHGRFFRFAFFVALGLAGFRCETPSDGVGVGGFRGARYVSLIPPGVRAGSPVEAWPHSAQYSP
jgi:hypothetical protein